jgi:hypothetical protein
MSNMLRPDPLGGLKAVKTQTRTLVFLLTIFAFTTNATAQHEEGANAVSLAVADAVRSSAVGSTALYFNPAAMHQFIQYSVETGYQFLNSNQGHVFTASAVDSATNQSLAAGMSYSYIRGDSPANLDRKGHQIRGGMATGYRGRDFSGHIGVGLRYLDLTVDDEKKDDITIDVGGLLVFNNILRIAAVGHNLIESDFIEAPRRVGLGTSLFYKGFLVSFDTVLDFETLSHTEAQYNLGAEYAIANQLPLRVGYQMDKISDTQYITGGLGYVSRTVAIDFGFRQNLKNKDDNIFSFNLRFFIP